MHHPYPLGTKVKITWQGRLNVPKDGPFVITNIKPHPSMGPDSYLYAIKGIGKMENIVITEHGAEFWSGFVEYYGPTRKYNLPDWW